MEFAELGVRETLLLAVALDAEDVFEAVTDAVSLARRFDEVVCEHLVLVRFVIERSHLIEVEFAEALVEHVDRLGVFLLVGGSLHDGVGDFHICEGVKHGDFCAENVLVVNRSWATSAKIMRDRRVILVGVLFDGLA